MTKQEFNEYVQAQGADILRFCRMTTASKIEGDELYQDTMLKLLEQLQHLNVDKNLKSYTLSVASSSGKIKEENMQGESGWHPLKVMKHRMRAAI